MKNLTETLADYIRAKVVDATAGRSGARLESRFIFHGPSLELLVPVYEALAVEGGIRISGAEGFATLPVLLQISATHEAFQNPSIGQSGRCDESHLLHLRNDPHCPSFVALVPPGLHNNMSVASTTDEFGVSALNNANHAPFEAWWRDEFVQLLVTKALEGAGLEGESLRDARIVAKHAAGAVDDVEPEPGSRNAAWRLLSRLFSVPSADIGLSPSLAVALACGMPSSRSTDSSMKSLQDVLAQLANALADGFGTGISLMQQNASAEVKGALDEFLKHLRARCDVPTAFERATPAFYLPADGITLEQPPDWWAILTSEKWTELMAEEPEEVGDLSIECLNPILPVRRGMPAIVQDVVRLAVSTGAEEMAAPVDVLLQRTAGGARGKQSISLTVGSSPELHVDDQVPSHKAPMSFKATALGHKAASIKVISLAHWSPGVLVSCRLADKLSPPKKPGRRAAGPNWEMTLALPGSGRYELLVFVSPDVEITEVVGVPDNATEIDEGPAPLSVVPVTDDQYQVEVDIDGKYQVDVRFQRTGQASVETCRVYIACVETVEEGCRSEFERLIKRNRQHLERFDAKAVIQLDRHARTSSLQSWMLEEQHVEKSFRPLVIAEDYASVWAPPNWDSAEGACLSQGRFLHDPRPDTAAFVPPPHFIAARCELAKFIRETDEQSGLMESAQLGVWLAKRSDFRTLIEDYLDAYIAWFTADPDVACWVDVVAVASLEPDGRTLSRIPDAILLSPLHPLRLAWHCVAQRVLHEAVDGEDPAPCPASSVIDPDCVPDLLTMSLQAPGGIERVDFVSVECSSDYWSVLWNGARLRQLAERCKKPPFDQNFGISVGGISSGFSSAQVARALEDVSGLLAAKSVVNLVVSSAGGTTDACNEGLASWCARRFGNGDGATSKHAVGRRTLEVFDTRENGSRPDEATIANLAEDTDGLVRWFNRQPDGAKPDLGIIAQLESAEPESTGVGMRSPLGFSGLIRHRVRRQLPGAFLSESRQGLQMPASGDVLADKVSACMLAMESRRDDKVGLRFAPNVHAVKDMLDVKRADFVAVSSSAIDPACFLAEWIKGTYLWDYDLPAYSSRAGDTSGYYLLSQVRDADRDGLRRVLSTLPGCDSLGDEDVEQILLEVARRGIPTVRGLSGDNTGATGDLGLFVAVRLLQDQFRTAGQMSSLLPVLGGSHDDVTIAIIVPVDPFRGYLADLAKSVGKDGREASLSRPDLLVVGIRLTDSLVRIKLTPVEVKCRLNTALSTAETADALSQARALSTLFRAIEARAAKSIAWRIAYQHLLLSMIGFGLRVYSQHRVVGDQASRWAEYHERIATAILCPESSIEVDDTGRLVVIDDSPDSVPHDWDSDGFTESVVIALQHASRIVNGDSQSFYDAVRARVGDWKLLPQPVEVKASVSVGTSAPQPMPELIDTTIAVASPIASTEHSADLDSRLASNEAVTNEPAGSPADSTNASEPESMGVRLSIGATVDGFEPKALKLNVSDTRLNQLNLGVVGDLGTGKTQLLKSLIYQIAKSTNENRGVKPSFLIFDYKRDYSNPDFVAATGARVVKPTRLPLNLFDTSMMGESVAPWLDRFRFFADVLDKVYTGIGPVQRDKLKGAVRAAYDACGVQGRAPTIYDIHSEYRGLLNGKSDSPMAIIDDLVDMEIFTRDPKEALPFNEFLDGVVVVSLDSLGQDDRSKNMLVAIMLNMFYENMLKTPKRPFVGSDPQLRVVDSYLLVDEADNIMRYEFEVLRKLLLQGREFGVGVILASQYLRHFKAGATDYREPLLTWFIHKVPNVTAAELGALGFTSDLGELSERVKSLSNHHCLYKSFDVAGEVIRGLPFYELIRNNSSD
ncbi:ATP-binding protein [Ralstonia pseudosolanacearum]|uniref:ATP-binding protein n=2 Tax=Ralstonia pseudosolanacearum TaxID=1310165 RepID=UPI002676D953|nr:ATP-binding protein [Ralstonia pseudosolanacearum]MDO3536306.1 ATP-binding protein [Ralstonia pseudosolanacearum]